MKNGRFRVLVRAGFQTGTGHKCYMIGVPWHIAETLPDGLEYEAALTEDGLLFRPIMDRPPSDLPGWAKASA